MLAFFHKFPSHKEDDPHLKSFTNQRYSFKEGNWKTFSKDDLVLLNKLGSGEFGEVLKGQLIEGASVRECAVKTLKGRNILLLCAWYKGGGGRGRRGALGSINHHELHKNLLWTVFVGSWCIKNKK